MITLVCCLCKKEFLTYKINQKYCNSVCFHNARKGIPSWSKGKTLHYDVWNKGKKCPASSGSNHPLWKGGRIITPGGYVFLYSPGHPNPSFDNYVFEHRLTMEKKIGRFLFRDEVVHHKNGVRTDNRICNLLLFKNKAEHNTYHKKQRIPT